MNESEKGMKYKNCLALVDPSHKVRQGGKGSVWDGQTYGRTDGHFQSTSGPFGHHRCSYEASQL